MKAERKIVTEVEKTVRKIQRVSESKDKEKDRGGREKHRKVD